jgi:transcriptional regulator with GAF, ATPase, and Fis domain/ABC-type uncharacterized transport system substrate-binding protein
LSGHDLEKGDDRVFDDVRSLLESTGDDTRLHVEYLELSDLPERDYFRQVADDFRHAYTGKNISVVYAVNFRALEFLIRHGDRVFPRAAIVFSRVEKRRLSTLKLGANVTGVVQAAPIGETIAAVLHILPDTERVFAVVGASETDRFIESVAKEELQPYEKSVEVIFPRDRSIDGLLDQVANLPEHSVVLFLTLIQTDSKDAKVPTNFVTLLSAASSAPTFSILDSFLGRGIVGGDLASMSSKATKAADQLRRVLNGESPADIPVVELATSRLMFDGRQLERWGIPEDRLPPGSIVRFKETSIWAGYKWYILGALILCTAQSFLIGALLLNRRRRHTAEASLAARLKFEALASKLSAALNYVSPSKLDERIEYWLPRVARALGFDRCALIEFADDEDNSRVLQSWTIEGVESLPDWISERGSGWWHAKLTAGEIVRIDSLDDLPPEAAGEARNFAEDGVKSHLAVPVSIGDAARGAFTIDQTSDETAWTDEVVHQVQLIGEFFADALGRRREERQLQDAFTEITRLKDQLKLENAYLYKEREIRHRYDHIIGESEAIKATLSQLELVADTESTILLLGETGTGKDLIADTIHQLSRRRDRPMIKINCAALPPGLIESELFGREEGAYTGATRRQEGRFEAADGSTILLDEVGELPLDVQVKLLRVLQDGEFERLGSPKPVRVDVRVIAATNRDLSEAVRQNRFREDLYYRLNVFPITVPPLRERKEDIPLMVWAFLEEFAKRAGKTIKSIRERDMEALRRYPWAGNVRELRNVIERAVITSTGPNLHLTPQAAPVSEVKSMMLDDVERRHILDVLEMTGWRIRGGSGAAEILGLKPSTLESRMVKLGIRRPSPSEVAG